MDSTAQVTKRRRENISTHLKKKAGVSREERDKWRLEQGKQRDKRSMLGVLAMTEGVWQQQGHRIRAQSVDLPPGYCCSPQKRTFLRDWDPKTSPSESLVFDPLCKLRFLSVCWVWAWASIGSHSLNCAMSFVVAVVFLRSASAIQASCTSLTYITDQVGHWVHIGPWQIDFEPSLIWLCCCQGGYISVINKLFTK